MKTTENNKLIAEFMGIVYPKLDNVIVIDNVVLKENELQYHTSWDWLKPVINKINSINKVELGDLEATDELIGNIHREDRLCNLIQAHEAVIEFIKSYNQIKEN